MIDSILAAIAHALESHGEWRLNSRTITCSINRPPSDVYPRRQNSVRQRAGEGRWPEEADGGPPSLLWIRGAPKSVCAVDSEDLYNALNRAGPGGAKRFRMVVAWPLN